MSPASIVSTLSRSSASRKPGSRARRASTIVLKLRVTAISYLPRFVVGPIPLGPIDVRVLPSLRPAGQQDHQSISIAAKIEPISRPPIDPAFLHSAAHALDVREVATAQTFHCDCDF